jgi:oligoendopeptidase F
VEMTTATTNHKIPQRNEIEEKYTWNLADIYKTDNDWEADFKKAQGIVASAQEFSGKLADSSETLYRCLEARSELMLILSCLNQYASLSRDLDNRVSKYQELTERVAVLGSHAAAAFAFLEPELLKVDEEKLRELASGFPKTDVYDFYIEELIRSREHIRSQEVEELLAMAAVVSRAPSNIFTMLDDADMSYPSIVDDKGNEIKLTKQRFARFMESMDRRVRRDAHEAFYTSYRDHVNTIAATLSAGVNRNVFYAKSRRFESALHASLFGDNIPVSVYRSLIDTTEAHLSGMHKYIELRRRLLKLDEFRSYDILCPLFPDQDFEVEYDKAVDYVLKAMKPLGETYQSDMRKGFERRWVDVFETEGKGSGAYSWSNFRTHPFILMNYNDTVDNMFTLAHEMGHAMHSHLTNQAQPFEKSQYSIFVAEVASTLNEGLLIYHLLDEAKDDRRRLYLLNRYVDNTIGTFFHQVLYARFELMIHEAVEKGGALSPDFLSGLWKELTQKYYGPTLAMDDFTAYKWSRIPHFYLNFYVYQYATSYAASQAILKKFLDKEHGIIDKYLEMLSSGGKDHPIELLKICGIDMSTPGPVEANLKLFEDQVDEMESLAGL